jgi:hypothetical protein
MALRSLTCLLAGLALACAAQPDPPPSGLALGLSSLDGYGLQTQWLEVDGHQVRAEVRRGLLLASDSGPRDLHEIAARDSRVCATEWSEPCQIHLSAVTEASDMVAAAAALQAEAEAQLGCTSGHTLERVRYATPAGLSTQIIDGGAPCGEAGEGAGYEDLSYASYPWSTVPVLPPEDAVAALWAEVLASTPEQSDAFDPSAVVVVTERAAGITRQRAVVIIDDVELSVVISETVDPTPLLGLLDQWPEATDVLTAPGGEVAVIRLGSSGLVAVRLSDGETLWEDRALPGRIVMAQWSQGEALAVWRSAVLR